MLQKKIGLTKSTIQRYESGAIARIKLPIIDAIANALDTTPAYLLGLPENNEEEKTNAPLFKLDYKKQIPILGEIAAGEPIFADHNIEGYIWTDKTCHDYALRIKGDSMINACILDNSLVVIDKDAVIDNGDIVVVLVDGENATVKRFYQYGDKVILKPENPNMKERELSAKDVRLLGKVKQVVLKVN